MDESVLKDIGLTPAEIKVYLTLLGLGSSSAGPILEKSKLHNSVVHRNLDRLIEKGLITFILQGKKRYYQAVNPRLLIDFLDEKKRHIEEILPELLKRQQLTKNKPKAVLYQGLRGIKEILYEMLESHSKVYVSYGGAQKSDDVMGTYFWKGFHRRREEKNITAQLIFHSSLRWWGDQLKKLKYTTVKYTSAKFEELTETIICGDKIGIIIWLDNPYGILIEEEVVAKSYRKFFELLWKESKN